LSGGDFKAGTKGVAVGRGCVEIFIDVGSGFCYVIISTQPKIKFCADQGDVRPQPCIDPCGCAIIKRFVDVDIPNGVHPGNDAVV
jgi:hypothetical protein